MGNSNHYRIPSPNQSFPCTIPWSATPFMHLLTSVILAPSPHTHIFPQFLPPPITCLAFTPQSNPPPHTPSPHALSAHILPSQRYKVMLLWSFCWAPDICYCRMWIEALTCAYFITFFMQNISKWRYCVLIRSRFELGNLHILQFDWLEFWLAADGGQKRAGI